MTCPSPTNVRAVAVRPRRVRSSQPPPPDATPPLLALLAARTQWRGLVVPARPVFVHDCRVFARVALEAWHLPELSDAVELCVSELATNAMCYGDGEFIGLSLTLDEEALLLEVFDQGAGEPFVNFADTNDEYGRGMALVLTLSDKWWVDAFRSFGNAEQCWKRVWCRFALPT